MNDPEDCDTCSGLATRKFVPDHVHFVGTKVTHAEYNPGLGCIVNNKAHKMELMKQKRVEEIGNEKPETIHKHFDQRRQEKIEQAYDKETNKAWVGDGSS